jgi:hypothetical protein
MWLKFDLTQGEIDYLCRMAGHDDRAAHVREYYDNIRKQIFQKLDWMTKAWYNSLDMEDPVVGWLRDVHSDPEQAPDPEPAPPSPRCPALPSNFQLALCAIPYKEKLRRAWANIDILEDNAWTDENSSALLLAASRTATYIKYRAASLYSNAVMKLDEKTAMYSSKSVI